METEPTTTPNLFDHRSPSLAKLAGALAAVQGELKHAKKSADNPFFKSSYADLPAVIDAAKALLAKNGLAVIQVPITDANDGISLVTELIHTSGEWVRSRYPIRPVKYDPQSIGSAITYARRYAYQSIIGIAAEGEDDDGNSANDRNGSHSDGGKNYTLKPSPAKASPQMSKVEPLKNPYAHVVQGNCKAKGRSLSEYAPADLQRCLEDGPTRAKLTPADIANMEEVVRFEREKAPAGLDDLPDFDSMTEEEREQRREIARPHR